MGHGKGYTCDLLIDLNRSPDPPLRPLKHESNQLKPAGGGGEILNSGLRVIVKDKERQIGGKTGKTRYLRQLAGLVPEDPTKQYRLYQVI